MGTAKSLDPSPIHEGILGKRREGVTPVALARKENSRDREVTSEREE